LLDPARRVEMILIRTPGAAETQIGFKNFISNYNKSLLRKKYSVVEKRLSL